ncbi:MAG: hypothetical protein N3B10_03070, partial [Armatimonadetes bacterium]|nr:hypothetical protein [Armatimonadota bacterium]
RMKSASQFGAGCTCPTLRQRLWAEAHSMVGGRAKSRFQPNFRSDSSPTFRMPSIVLECSVGEKRRR